MRQKEISLNIVKGGKIWWSFHQSGIQEIDRMITFKNKTKINKLRNEKDTVKSYGVK